MDELLSSVISYASDITLQPGPIVRYCVALLLAYPVALIHLCVTARTSRSIQNAFFAFNGLWMAYYIFGSDVIHMVIHVVMVCLILKVLGGSLMSLLLTWAVAMGHLLYAHIDSGDGVHKIHWNIPMCLMVLRTIGLASNLYDGSRKEESLSADQKHEALKSLPSFGDMLGYCFFFGTILVGPFFSFRQYQEFLLNQSFKLSAACIAAGARALVDGAALATLYVCLNYITTPEYLGTQDYAEEPFIKKLLLIVAVGHIYFLKYCIIWKISEGACIITGLGRRKAIDESSEEVSVYYDDACNAHFLKIAFSITIEDTIKNYNVRTNAWIAMHVFKRLKILENRTLSHLLTMLFIAFWHGLWSGYYITFTFEFLYLVVERQFIGFLRKDLQLGISLFDQPWPIFIPLWTAALVLKNLLVLYLVPPFTLLRWDEVYNYHRAVYSYGHIIAGVWLLLYLTIIPLVKKWRKRKVH